MLEDELNFRLQAAAGEKKYREFVEELGRELDRRSPGVFQWRFGTPSDGVVEGLIITKSDVPGYVFAFGCCDSTSGSRGGVWLEDARHSYAAGVMEQRAWELGVSHHRVKHLESYCSESPADIVDWLLRDWAFERPWRAPPPIDRKAEKKRLQKIAEGLKARSDVPVIVEAAAEPGHNLTPQADAALREDLRGLLLDRIRENFPPDKRGSLALKSTVLLASYETTSPPARDRQLCLVVAGPERRSDPQQVRIHLEAVIPANQDHCWERERWRWHVDSADATHAIQWGEPVPIESLAPEASSISHLAEKVAAGNAEPGEKAALAILLQDEGRLLDALALYEVEVDGDLKRLCGGQKIYPPAHCAYADEKWVERLREWMRSCAPWLLGRATRDEAERLATWAAAKKGRKRRYPVLKLLIFPGQHHSRKASLILTSSDLSGRHPLLRMEATASNARLHESAWKRPLAIDLARYQLRTS